MGIHYYIMCPIAWMVDVKNFEQQMVGTKKSLTEKRDEAICNGCLRHYLFEKVYVVKRSCISYCFRLATRILHSTSYCLVRLHTQGAAP